MIKIRKNVFETNSSSSHSLAYQIDPYTCTCFKPDKNYNIALYGWEGDDEEKGILSVNFGRYNWSGDPCKGFRDKLSYLMAQLADGWALTYYPEGDSPSIKITTEEEWDNVINSLFLKKPEVIRVLDFIKEKCPNIKGFDFKWYSRINSYDIEDAYDNWKTEHNIVNDIKIPDLQDEFFKEKSNSSYVVGFGNIDHQSAGYLSELENLDSYLFDDNIWVIITNDNV